MRGFEPLTPCLQGRCSPNWATPPFRVFIFILIYIEVGLSGLEPPTSRLSGVRSNRLSYKPISLFFFQAGSHLLSHAVSSIVSSAAYVLTIVFGMGTGVSRKRITTGKYLTFSSEVLRNQASLVCYRGHSPYTHSISCFSFKQAWLEPVYFVRALLIWQA